MDTETKKLKIVVVEDHRESQRAVRRALLGCYRAADIVLCGSAEEGLAAVDADTTLLITDYDLPGLSGGDLIGLARPKVPRMKIILMSGDTDNLHRCGIEHPETLMLAKPLDFNQFLATVAQAIDDT